MKMPINYVTLCQSTMAPLFIVILIIMYIGHVPRQAQALMQVLHSVRKHSHLFAQPEVQEQLTNSLQAFGTGASVIIFGIREPFSIIHPQVVGYGRF